MKWIVQENLFNEREFDHFTDTIRKLDFDLQLVKVVPFVHTLEPEIADPGDCVVYGSFGLTRIAKNRKWFPGAFFDEINFDFRTQRFFWRKEMLNHDAEITLFGDAEFDGIKHVRPVDDGKVFAGELIDGERFSFWKEKCIQHHTLLTPETEIMVSSVKKIYTETRCFIVDGSVVSASQYVVGGRRQDWHADVDAVAYANRMCKIWDPADAFVMDVAKTPDGFKIIEVNCFNCSGFYGCDTSLIVQAVAKLYEKIVNDKNSTGTGSRGLHRLPHGQTPKT